MEPQRIDKREGILPNTFSNSEISTSNKTGQPLKTQDQQEKVISIFNDLAQQPRETLRPLPSTPDSLPPQSPLPPPPRGMQPRRPLPSTPGTSFRAQGQVSAPPQRGLPSTPDSLPPQTPLPPTPQGMQPRRPLPSTPGTSFRAQGQVSGPPQKGLPSTPSSLPPQSPLPPPPRGMQPSRPSTPPPGTSIHSQGQVSGPPRIPVPPPPSDPYKGVTKDSKYGQDIDNRLQNHVAEMRYNEANQLSEINEKDVKIQNNSFLLPIPELPFHQANLISDLKTKEANKEVDKEYKDYKTLSKINARFDGLCEIISNKVLIDDLLGSKTTGEDLEKEITLESINQKTVKKSHITSVMPVFNLALSLISKYYPDNIFSYKDQSKLVRKTVTTNINTNTTEERNKINKDILKKGLDRLPKGEVLKVIVFSKNVLELSGHSLLLKKVESDKYIFFDPSMGEYRDVTLDKLENMINQQILMNDGTDVLFMKGSDYLKRLGVKPNS